MRVPIFPLDNVVLFPSVQVPLYIFEPRYCQMTAAALEDDRRIGMVAVQPQHRDEMTGEPPVFPIGCLGEISYSEPRKDSTYNLVLQGTNRFRIQSEIPKEGGRLYRLAEIELLTEEPNHPRDILDAVRARVLELMRHMVPDRAASFRVDLFAKLDDSTFVNAFCQSLDFSAVEKQLLLAANSVRERADQLVELMDFRLTTQALKSSPGPETVQ
jgi:Lon protease-like protein